ncbi:MAG: class I SAM-dependent methyltransferase [Verrucomicrobiota bacterium]
MDHKKYLSIVAACESDLKKYGDNYLGVGWTKRQEDAYTRYQVMLEVIKRNTRGAHDADGKVSLLDFGCGASHLYEYILRQQIADVDYTGLDLSEDFIQLSRSKFPFLNYYHVDILEDRIELPFFDYIVINGVFTSKCDLSFEEMLTFFQNVVSKLFHKARAGVAFNVMSKQVDWERDDLFHLPFDTLADFLTKKVSKNFVFRSDYGLYEYTTYVYQ